MREFFHTMKVSFLLAAILYVILGLVLLLWPGVSAVVFCYAFGGVLLAYGVVTVVSFFLRDSRQGSFVFELLLGIIAAALGLLFYNIYKLLNLDCYVLGGGLTNLGEPLFAGIRSHFQALRVGADTMDPVHFLPAHFSSAEIGIYGAALAARAL